MRALMAAAVFLAVLAACGGDKNGNTGGGGNAGFGGGSGGSGGTPPAPCTIDDECPEGAPFCDQGVCVECLEGDHKACESSAKGPQCTDNECGPCTEDAACSPGVCDGDSGRCVECRTGETQCAGKEGFPICNEDGRCVACLVDADCKRGGTCESQLCVGGCQIDDDCGAGEVCNIPGGKTFGTCGKLCDPQKADQCPLGQQCDWTGFGASVEGVCVKPSDEGLAKGATCDQQDDQCTTGLICAPSSSLFKGLECLGFCDLEADPDPCGKGFHCDELTAGALSVGICRGDACVTDADCGDGMACDGAGNFNGQRFENVCVVTVGEKQGGEACADNAECASGTCLTQLGVCYGACTTSEDCPESATCGTVGWAINGIPNTYTTYSSICLSNCESTSDCGAGVECQILGNGQSSGTVADRDAAPVCWFTRAGGGSSAGGICNRDTDCAGSDATCVVGQPVGFCTGPCGTDTDCGERTFCADFVGVTGGPDGVTGTSDDRSVELPQCLGEECVADADCQMFAPGWTCQPFLDVSDPARKSIQNRCAPRPGTTAGGERCTSSAGCASGFCFSPSYLQEDCNDEKDNDADGKTDCADSDCFVACNVERDCTDGVDNDNDGAKDCGDGDCFAVCEFESDCNDGVDNDSDGYTDCDDFADCGGFCGGFGFEFPQNCADGLDDDGDGQTDCNDTDCQIFGQCNEFVCNDNQDDDGDGLVDCQDFDCVALDQCPTAERGDEACSDGKDNDNDRVIDCADDSCRETPACRETACDGGDCCSDDLDNDEDRFTDCSDSDCAEDPACSEAADECNNGMDDDHDGFTDCVDFDCAEEAHCAETNCDGGNCCTNGTDDDLDGGTDCADRDCFGTVACSETACGTANCCTDAADSDGDELVDCADPDCRNDAACREVACGDGADNDGDGLTDCDDQDCANNLASCGICYQSCDVDADCGAGAICAPEVASALVGVGVSLNDRDFVYLNSCFKP